MQLFEQGTWFEQRGCVCPAAPNCENPRNKKKGAETSSDNVVQLYQYGCMYLGRVETQRKAWNMQVVIASAENLNMDSQIVSCAICAALWGNLGQCLVKPSESCSAASCPGNTWNDHPLRWIFVTGTLEEVPTSRIGTHLDIWVLAQSTAQHISKWKRISDNSYSYAHSKSSAHIPCEANAQVKDTKTT